MVPIPRDIRLQVAAVVLALLVPASALATTGNATIYVRVATEPLSAAQATIELTSEEYETLPWVVHADAKSPDATLTRIPPGLYLLTVQLSGFSNASTQFVVDAGDVLSLVARMAADGGQTAEASRIEVVDRHRSWYGTVFGKDQVSNLPASDTIWSLLETADPLTITDRIDGGGISSGDRALIGSHASSWTQASYRLGDLDVTDLGRPGTPLLYPDLALVRDVSVASVLMPIDIGPPGPAVTLMPRRPGRRLAGTAIGEMSPRAFQSRHPDGPPSIAGLNSWGRGDVLVSGPVRPDRLGMLLAGAWTRSNHLGPEGVEPFASAVGSLFSHLVHTRTPADEIRVIAALQRTRHPSGAGTRFAGNAVTQRDRYFQLQSTWDRRPAAGRALWSISAGVQEGRFTPQWVTGPEFAVIERLLDGTVPELVSQAESRRRKWSLHLSAQPDLGGLSARHSARGGLILDRVSAKTWPGPSGPIAELVDGLPARIWEYDYAGSASQWQQTTLAAYVDDQIVVSPRITGQVAVRFDLTRGSADGAPTAITWASFSPRFSLRWKWAEFGRNGDGRLTFFAGVARYPHQLPLAHLAFGDPSAPQGFVYRWEDANADGALQRGEIGPLVARVGPGAGDGSITSIDPKLERPYTDEALFGWEARLSDSLTLRLAAVVRRDRNLIGAINVGAPLPSYDVSLVPDRGVDWLDPVDDRLLPVYNRLPESFGKDEYLLTNHGGSPAEYDGFEITGEKRLADRWQLMFGATAGRSRGVGGYRGFEASENDHGLVGEAFGWPNASTHARGRLFFERGYVIKLSGTYEGPKQTRISATARYQDGQHFSRLVIAPDLNQGTEAIRAFESGRSRFTFTHTVDVRIEKRFALSQGRQYALILDVFNLMNKANEVEERVVTGPAYRSSTAVQPPRSMHLVARFDF
jgi:hypothetical protein